ncbi:MAG: hypothetical protein ACQEW6_20340 [Bacillota bacterium]
MRVRLAGDKKIVLNLHADWYAKRSAFYEMLREYEIPCDTREKYVPVIFNRHFVYSST